MRYLMGLLVMWILVIVPVHAQGKLCSIRVRSGQVVVGTLLDHSRGVYTVRTLRSKIVRIPEAAVRSIDIQGGMGIKPGPAASLPRYDGTVESAQRMMMNDPELFLSFKRMSEDPVFQELLKDPELTAMIQAGDLDEVRTDPKFVALAADPDFLLVVQKLMGVKPVTPATGK